MSISKSLRKLEKRQQSANTQYVEPLIPGRPAYTTPAGVDVTPDTALRMSAVYACVRLLGDTISSLPLGAYVRRGRNLEWEAADLAVHQGTISDATHHMDRCVLQVSAQQD